MFMGWKGLGLAAELNIGNNLGHASARPFEALAKRANWLGIAFGIKQLRSSDAGYRVPLTTTEAECDDPVVLYKVRLSSCL